MFTVRPEEMEAARKACALTMMGEVMAEGIWMEKGGKGRRIETRGYEHKLKYRDYLLVLLKGLSSSMHLNISFNIIFNFGF